MAIQNEVTVGSLLVLTNARLDQRCVFHRGKTKRDVFTNTLQRSRADYSLAVCRIEGAATRVVGDLEAAAVAAGDAVEESFAVIAPHGKMSVGEAGVSRGRTEEEYVLLGGTDDSAQGLRKQFAHPWAAGEYVVVGLEPRAVGENQMTKRVALQPVG